MRIVTSKEFWVLDPDGYFIKYLTKNIILIYSKVNLIKKKKNNKIKQLVALLLEIFRKNEIERKIYENSFLTVTRGVRNIANEYADILATQFEDTVIDVYSLEKFSVENTIQIKDFTLELEKNLTIMIRIFIMARVLLSEKYLA